MDGPLYAYLGRLGISRRQCYYAIARIRVHGSGTRTGERDNAFALSPVACHHLALRFHSYSSPFFHHVFLLCLGVILALRYDTPLVVWIRCLFEKFLWLQRKKEFPSPAKVLLRHRLGRRVAAEAGPATMPSALSSGSSSRGRSHTFPSRNSLYTVLMSGLPCVDSEP
ncbi:hypothetical protein GGR58DRAFT_314961 [Xylaria digitata]|nr:hypothetical protein GGR58DRAFT_314961 [Xylaria digitata]